jgi:hypothetical protein
MKKHEVCQKQIFLNNQHVDGSREMDEEKRDGKGRPCLMKKH